MIHTQMYINIHRFKKELLLYMRHDRYIYIHRYMINMQI